MVQRYTDLEKLVRLRIPARLMAEVHEEQIKCSLWEEREKESEASFPKLLHFSGVVIGVKLLHLSVPIRGLYLGNCSIDLLVEHLKK